MARRYGPPLYSTTRYCGNTNKKEEHDLDHENENCKIDQIIKAGHAVGFDSLLEAHERGFDNCAYCIGDSRR